MTKTNKKLVIFVDLEAQIMKYIVLFFMVLSTIFSHAQEKDEQKLVAIKKANDFVYEANNLMEDEDYILAEMEYRKAISEQPNIVSGSYNLGNSYYKKGNYAEALYRVEQSVKNATNKSEKHQAYHNIGNILMQNKLCKEAVEAFKSALRNNPKDDETRYNLGLAKECAKHQEEEKKDDQDKQDENKEKEQDKEDKKDKEGDDKEKPEDEGDQEEKEGEDKEDEDGKPKDEKKDEGKGDEDKQKENQKPKPQPGQLSPQQIKSLLEAMNNQEEKVQEKMNAKKQKGVKVQTEKDW